MGFTDNFEKTLKDFFFAKHPRQIKKIPEIMTEFKGQERAVMLHLCKKYKVNPNTIDGLSNSAPLAAVTEEVVEVVEKIEEPVVAEAAPIEDAIQEEPIDEYESEEKEK
ncbi:MAG: hypothetical protein ACJAZ2_000512 [Glaciecola sp.]|jgi:hypothetical protein